MRRVEPAYLDLLPITHLLRPGYLPGPKVALDPVRMAVVWDDAPRRILPAEVSVPRVPLKALAFARVAAQRQQALRLMLERGSAVMLVLDDPKVTPSDLGLAKADRETVTVVLPVLPSPLAPKMVLPGRWKDWNWGALLGLFPFPSAEVEIETRVVELQRVGASFAVAAPLLLTPKDRHRILDGCDGSGDVDQMENCLFHADVGRRLHALERHVGVAVDSAGLAATVCCMVPKGLHPNAVRTAALLRLWARRLDQCDEESSWGWRLRRAASALECLPHDPEVLASEDNLRVVPGFDAWVESFTRSLWNGGEPLESAWQRWSGIEPPRKKARRSER